MAHLTHLREKPFSAKASAVAKPMADRSEGSFRHSASKSIHSISRLAGSVLLRRAGLRVRFGGRLRRTTFALRRSSPSEALRRLKAGLPTVAPEGAKVGRAGETRTHDPLHPMQVRYQAAPRPEPRRKSKTPASARGKGILVLGRRSIFSLTNRDRPCPTGARRRAASIQDGRFRIKTRPAHPFSIFRLES
jgi:hypothetical protein